MLSREVREAAALQINPDMMCDSGTEEQCYLMLITETCQWTCLENANQLSVKKTSQLVDDFPMTKAKTNSKIRDFYIDLFFNNTMIFNNE